MVDTSELLISSLLISAVFGGCVLLFMYIVRMLKDNQKYETVSVKNVNKANVVDKQHSATTTKATKKKEARWGGGRREDYTHPWLITTLKGHTDQILDMDISNNGKYLASCAPDRTVWLWNLGELGPATSRRSLRVNISLDHATHVCWSPDARALVLLRASDHHVEVWRVERGLSSTSSTVSWNASKNDDLVALDVASTGRYLLTATELEIRLWTSRGRALTTLDTHLLHVCKARVSPCARFVAAVGRAPHARVWCIAFNAAGDFLHAKRVFDLVGHEAGLYDVAFDGDSSHMATVSKDGTWRLFKTNVEYDKGEDPRLLASGCYLNNDNDSVRLALSPSADIIAISTGSSIQWFSAQDGSPQGQLDLSPISGGVVTAIAFDSAGRWLLTAAGRHLRVFHNVPGRRAAIADAQHRLKHSNPQTCSAAMRDRLRQIVNENETFLQEITTLEAKYSH